MRMNYCLYYTLIVSSSFIFQEIVIHFLFDGSGNKTIYIII